MRGLSGRMSLPCPRGREGEPAGAKQGAGRGTGTDPPRPRDPETPGAGEQSWRQGQGRQPGPSELGTVRRAPTLPERGESP